MRISGGVSVNWEEFLEKVGPKYVEILNERGDDEFTFTLSLGEVAFLHGLVSAALDHPGIPNKPDLLLEFVQKFRAWYKQVWVDVGLTEEEADFLDRLSKE